MKATIDQVQNSKIWEWSYFSAKSKKAKSGILVQFIAHSFFIFNKYKHISSLGLNKYYRGVYD